MSHAAPRRGVSLKVPGAQALHTNASPRLYRPCGHGTDVGSTDPAGQAYPEAHGPVQEEVVRAAPAPYLPASQRPLQIGDLKPDVLPNTPAGQSTHAPAPAALYRPAPQMTSVAVRDPAGQKYPASHCPLHVSTDTPAADPNRPAGHSAVQFDVVSPVVFPNRPAAQSVHTPCPPTLNFPGRHAAAVAFVDPAAHAYPGAHMPGQEFDDRPGAALNCPAGHAPVQFAVASPLPVPKRPAGQSRQAPDPDTLYRPAPQTSTVALVDPDGHACPALQFPLQLALVRPC